MIYSGIITDEDYNRLLTGQSAIRVFEIMRRSDGTVHAALQVCKLPILSASWTIEPASEDQSDIDIANFIEHELFERNVNFHDFVRQALTMLDFGFSITEKTYELTEFEGQTRIGIKSLSFRKQKSLFKWETENGKPGITQQLAGERASIPMAKLMIFTNDKEGDNYEGISVLRYAYKHWDMKDKLDRINLVGIEKTAVGVPILITPPNADPNEVENAIEGLKNLRANEEGYQKIPQGWDLKMLETGKDNLKMVLPTIQYHDRQIMKSVLAQFFELGATGGSGSRAVSDDQSQLFMLSEESAAKTIATTIQDQLIKQMVDLNYTQVKNGYPKVKFSKIGDDSIEVLANAVAKFVSAGVLTTDPGVEKHVREAAHLPAMTKEVEELHLEKSKLALEQAKNPPQVDPLTGKPAALPAPKEKPKPADNKKTIKASIEEARLARENLLLALVV